jgi:hypothetical protein
MGWQDNDENNQSEDLLNDELQTSAAELETKKQSLYNTRLGIIKNRGGQEWTPNSMMQSNVKSPTQPKATNDLSGGLNAGLSAAAPGMAKGLSK